MTVRSDLHCIVNFCTYTYICTYTRKPVTCTYLLRLKHVCPS
jgi:hypothetical protein